MADKPMQATVVLNVLDYYKVGDNWSIFYTVDKASQDRRGVVTCHASKVAELNYDDKMKLIAVPASSMRGFKAPKGSILDHLWIYADR